MKIILDNGTELNPIIVTGGVRYVQGMHRDSLSFVFEESTSLDELEAIFTEANCERIIIVEDSGAEYIHKAYTILAELAKKSVMVTPATDETEAVYETRVFVSMAQRTYAENQIAENTAALNALLTGGNDNV